MPEAIPQSVAQHWDVLWVLLLLSLFLMAALVGFVNTLIWRFVVKPLQTSIIELKDELKGVGEKFQGFVKDCAKCRLELEKEFVNQKSFARWQEGRDGPNGLWDIINKHEHDEKGRVVRI